MLFDKMGVRINLFLVVISFFGVSCQSSYPEKLDYTVTDFSELQSKKDNIEKKEKEALAFYSDLMEKANEALKSKPFTVINKSSIPPSGNKHDYMSIGPYWWPNPDTENGLPYIRKDGEINPETRTNLSDCVEMANFFKAVDALGKAFYFSEKEEYAEKVVAILEAWYLDAETRMNPNLNYGQAVPGSSDGRPFGIIEMNGIRDIIICLEILENGNQLNEAIQSGMNKWLRDYSYWLQNSELGKMEGTRSNNHGTWYDVQLCNILFYLGEEEQIKTVLEKAKERIASQIESDGSQPHELARTKSFSYSTMNLSAFTALAKFGQKVDVDLWNFETTDGRSIRKAYEYLIPYALNQKKWEYQQITMLDASKAKFVKMAKEAVKTFGDKDIEVKLDDSEVFENK